MTPLSHDLLPRLIIVTPPSGAILILNAMNKNGTAKGAITNSFAEFDITLAPHGAISYVMSNR